MVTAPEPQDVPAWPAADVGEIPFRDCFAEMVGMPEYCRLRDGVCEADACREREQVAG